MHLALVGHGSIGSRYKNFILKDFKEVDNFYIVENNEDTLSQLKSENYNCFESLDALKKKDIKITHGIVANWGPDHINTAMQLIDLGCRRIIIEKPISCRIDELKTFKNVCLEKNIFATIHHHWNYTDIQQTIKNAAQKNDLGEPVGVRLLGGAVCLSTNGVHFLDLACKILDSIPKGVVADLEMDYINPRNKKFLNIGGCASYKMSNGKFIHVSFSNSNSQAFRTEIVYRHGIINISTDLKLNCFKRREEDIINYGDKITRYGDLKFIEEITYIDRMTIKDVLYNLIHGEIPKVTIEEAENSLLMVLGAIQSHLKGARVSFENITDQGVLIS